jgi:DNA-binding NarL/FixJ family response regulator
VTPAVCSDALTVGRRCRASHRRNTGFPTGQDALNCAYRLCHDAGFAVGAVLAPAITRRLFERYTQRPAAPSTGSNEALGRLTPREHEVVEHVARGRTNAQIGEALVISEATVKTHAANILAKLAVHDRVQIVVFAYEQGVVKASERAGPRDPE